MLSNKEKTKLKNKWIVKSLPEDKLEDIAKGIFNGDIYSTINLSLNKIDFSFKEFKYWKPNKPFELGINDYTESLSGKRKEQLFELLHKEKHLEEYREQQEIYNYELKYYRENYSENYGLLYEYLNKKNEMLSLHYYPCFDTFNILNKKDSKKVIEYYKKLSNE